MRVGDESEISDHDIDVEHKAVMREVLEDGQDVGVYEFLYHVTNVDR